MRKLVFALCVAWALTPAAGSAQEARVFACQQEGNTFYYKVGPNEFRHYLSAGNWLANECTDTTLTAECRWQDGVLTVFGNDGFISEFDTNTAVFRYGDDQTNTTTRCVPSATPQ